MELFIGPKIEALIDLALTEDEVGFDATSAPFFAESDIAEARLIARHRLIMAGGPVAEAVFERIDPEIEWRPKFAEGGEVEAGEIIAELAGPAAALLTGERTALNFLQRMCGVATTTDEHVRAAGDADLRVADTRKTIPGWRMLDKYAVRCGGGANHRFNLAGGVMVKENHVAAAGGIGAAIEKVTASVPHTLKIEVEVERLDQVGVAVDAGADVVMLDNMDNETMVRAVDEIRAHPRGEEVVIEGSGNIDCERLATLDGVGLDVVSVGALTHSAPAADISMRFEARETADEE